jgi:hypothetical protein
MHRYIVNNKEITLELVKGVDRHLDRPSLRPLRCELEYSFDFVYNENSAGEGKTAPKLLR